MLFIPLPFVVAILLLLLLARMFGEQGRSSVSNPFFLLILGYFCLSIVIGLRWGYGLAFLLPVMSVLAAALPPLAWIAFSGLVAEQRRHLPLYLHAVPALLVLLQIGFWPFLIDWFIVVIQAGYGIALLIFTWRGPDALTGATLDNSTLAHRMMVLIGVMLLMSAIVDTLIAIDFARSGGRYAVDYVVAANIIGIFLLGTASAVAGRSHPNSSPEDEPANVPAAPDQEAFALAAQIEDLVKEKQLFRDPDLTLNRLARKAMVPARRISSAINRTRGQSVSRYINSFRISEACRLLENTDHPITTIMFEAGFQTKSNFNREFRAHTNSSPASWRASHGQSRDTLSPEQN